MIPIHIVTIVLDGMPWITHHLPVFNRLKHPWTWTIAHGAAENVKDTRWMKSQPPRLSTDGTTEYLAQICRQHPRVTVIERLMWQGKTEMCNACIEGMSTPCVLLQVDSDEIWTTEQIDNIATMFEAMTNVDRMQFWCRFYYGPNIVAGPRDGNSYGCRQDEWMRAWKILSPSQRFITHEPPEISDQRGFCLGRISTHGYGLEFDHFAYATRAQVSMKEKLYGYAGAVAGWDRLQANQNWPVNLKPFLPWVDEKSTADLLIR